MNFGIQSCWFRSVTISSIGVSAEEDDFDATNVNDIVKNIIRNLNYCLALNDDSENGCSEETNSAELLYSVLEIFPILGTEE